MIPDPVEEVKFTFAMNPKSPTKGELKVTVTPPESKSQIEYYTAYFFSTKQELLNTETFHGTNVIRIKRDEKRRVFILRITATNSDEHESEPDKGWKLYIPKNMNCAAF